MLGIIGLLAGLALLIWLALTALPGTPSIQNGIPSVRLGTDLFAGAGLGLFGVVTVVIPLIATLAAVSVAMLV